MMDKKKKKNQPVKRLSGHTKLEPRRLLNADFSLAGGALTLFDFDGTVIADPDLVTVDQSGTTITFVLSDGDWLSPDMGIATGTGTDTLTVDNS